MQELINPDSLKKIKGEILRVLVSQLSGPIYILVNLTPRRVLSNLAGLSLDKMFTALSKDNFTVNFWFFVNGLFGCSFCIFLFEVNFHLLC